ncbi:LOW QUALITY PROTEIN: regulator of G-protein signaling 7 [Tupaia chinensis]|uniref:LOW QUALITY PROTEIN: regulator of G-protein signaling 7 n=1 Tax=Tupaia chinensis TaxID=246437 RepID=UPI000FFC7751|nr:LOW QUALITY PROTEIN: regulator of G-protein signaling 7 [Tupaia chinensis]
MAQGNNYGQTSNGVADESPNMLVYRKMEDVIARMQDEKNGIPIRTVKSFLSKIPSVFSGSDIVQWLIKNLTIEDPVEALHLGTLMAGEMAAHGYFFPISDHVLTLKDDGTFYRFQTPYFWPSNCWEPENTDYAVYLCKRTMQNKARLELADYEAESLARLQRAFARKWEFIFMQAEAQAKVDKKRDKIERKILDSQERAFWDVHRPVPGCVNTTEVDIKKSSRMRNPHKTRKSVYGLQNDIRSHSPTHTPTPDTKPPTEDELHQQIKYWQIQLDRHRLKMSKVADSLLSYTEQYLEYDPFLVPPDPSNPWLSDDTTFWELEASKEPSQQRVKRWGFGMDEALKDPVGREQFLKFLESEFSSENLRFWLAVEDLKKRPMREVPSRVQEIWQEFLAPGAPSAINLDSKSYDKTTQNVKEPGRYTFEDAQEHIYKLMKSDSYPRFIRSSAYQELLQAKKKKARAKVQATAKCHLEAAGRMPHQARVMEQTVESHRPSPWSQHSSSSSFPGERWIQRLGDGKKWQSKANLEWKSDDGPPPHSPHACPVCKKCQGMLKVQPLSKKHHAQKSPDQGAMMWEHRMATRMRNMAEREQSKNM